MSSETVARIQKAIFAAIEGLHSETGAASLNDVLSALASAEARYIANIPDHKHRKAVLSGLNDVRSDMIDLYLKHGGGPKVQTVVMHGGRN